MQYKDEEGVQTQVQYGRYQDGLQGCLAVSQGAQHTGGYVIGNGREEACEDHSAVPQAVIHDHLIRPEEPQGYRKQQLTEQRQKHRQCQSQLDGGGDVPAEPVVLLSAEALCDQYAEAVGESQGETDDQKEQGPHVAYGGKGIVPKSFAHDQCVHEIIKLLEHAGEQQRPEEA